MALFDKDGILVTLIEMIPCGGLITAPFHLAAGNHGHAAAAAGAVLDVAIPGVGGKLLKAAKLGKKTAVVVAAARQAGKALVKDTVKDSLKKRGNGIHKHHRR